MANNYEEKSIMIYGRKNILFGIYYKKDIWGPGNIVIGTILVY